MGLQFALLFLAPSDIDGAALTFWVFLFLVNSIALSFFFFYWWLVIYATLLSVLFPGLERHGF